MGSATISWSNIQSICSTHMAFKGAEAFLRPILEEYDHWPTVDDLNHVAKKLLPDFPWTFVTQERVPRRAKSRGQASLSGYVTLIGTQGKIPVRESNVHDFLNGLSFLMFPKSKLQLNLRHHLESPHGLKAGENRTRTQDLLTVFDEGGVIRLIDPNGAQSDLIFGHAIYEHLIKGLRVRAARLDLTPELNITDCNNCILYESADQLFAKWLTNPENCRSAAEFSSVWIEP